MDWRAAEHFVATVGIPGAALFGALWAIVQLARANVALIKRLAPPRDDDKRPK
jgi:hypothetical protein